jgi:hypothetical protein
MTTEATSVAGPGGPRRVRRRWPGTLAWALWGLTMAGVAGIAWFDHLLRQAGRTELVQLLTASGVPYALAVLSGTTAGAVLASRRPRHPVGWLLLALGITVVASGVTDGYARYALLARPGSLPSAGYVAVYADHSFIPWPALLGFVLLLTPTGALPSRGWRWWAWVAAAGPALFMAWRSFVPGSLGAPYRSVPNPLAIPALTGWWVPVVGAVAGATTVLAIPVAAVALVLRFRRARGAERQQLRWVALAAGLAAVAVAVTVAGAATRNDAVRDWSTGTCVALVPLGVTAAVLRYRLYDLDRIISRTLAYGALTVLLGGGYAGVVLGLGQLLGKSHSLVVAAATLALAAVFQPARRRVQGLVDRRFDRRRYDAARTIAAFSARLRQQVDLNALRADLLAVVEQTMQPTQASLWLRRQP